MSYSYQWLFANLLHRIDTYDADWVKKATEGVHIPALDLDETRLSMMESNRKYPVRLKSVLMIVGCVIDRSSTIPLMSGLLIKSPV